MVKKMANENQLIEISKLLQKARKQQQKSDEAVFAVYQVLEDIGINLDVPSKAENADCLNDAISCYIQYGEFGCKNLILEIQEQIAKMDGERKDNELL